MFNFSDVSIINDLINHFIDVLSFNDDLLGMKPNCSYFMDILRVEEEFEYDYPDMLAIRDYVQEILSTADIDEKLPNLKNTDFNYLSQDR
nr:hypothetical protein [Bacillus norwichensis]